MPSFANWFTWAILAACFAALTAIFAKVGVRDVDPDLATLIRTALILCVLVPFVWYTGKWSSPLAIPGRTLLFLALSAVAAGASWICYFRALKVGEVSQVAPVDKSGVLLVAIFAFLFLGERLSVTEWTGVVLIAAGVLLFALK